MPYKKRYVTLVIDKRREKLWGFIMNLLTINGMTKAFTDKILFENADFSINENEKVDNSVDKSYYLESIKSFGEKDKN